MKDNLLVFALILIASILFFSGCTDSTKNDFSEKDEAHAENASVVVTPRNEKIRLILVEGGDNIPSFGYSLKDSVTIKIDGKKLSDDNLTGNIGWEVGETLYIGGNPPVLEDVENNVDSLGIGDYLVTVIILETVVFEDDVQII